MPVRIPTWFKPAFWGAVVGIVVISILGFTWWRWVLGSTAERLARERFDLTRVCVERFIQQPEAMTKLTEFQKTAAWQQSQFVEKGGWATAPGSTTPNAAVARACAEALAKANTYAAVPSGINPFHVGYVGGYVAEGKAHLAALWTALQACAQMNAGSNTACTARSLYSRTGINAGGLTSDGRWFVSGDPIVSFVNNNFTLNQSLTANGQANTGVAGIDISFSYNMGSNPPYQFLCSKDGVAAPC